MRDPKRIPIFLDVIESIWRENPDMRFGQLIMNLTRTPGGFADTWNWEDDAWFERFMRYSEKGWESS